MNPHKGLKNSVSFRKGKIGHHVVSRDGTQAYHEQRTGEHFSNIVREGNMDYISPYHRQPKQNIMQSSKPAKNFIAECCQSISNMFFGKNNSSEKTRRVSLEEENPLLSRRRTHISGGKGTRRNKRTTILDIIHFLNKHPEIKQMIMEESCPIHKSEKMLSDAYKMIDLIDRYDSNISLEELKMKVLANRSRSKNKSIKLLQK